MAHPFRQVFAESLRLSLDARVVYDRRGDRWDAGRRSWLLHDTRADYHLVIQDDAVPCPDLLSRIEDCLEAVPAGSPLVLYSSATGPYRQLAQLDAGVSYLVSDRIVWGPAIVCPVSTIRPMIEHCDALTAPDLRRLKGNYDLRLSRYFEDYQIPVWYSWPSLVDHRDLPSLVRGRGGGRHAALFAGPEAPVWTGRIARI